MQFVTERIRKIRKRRLDVTAILAGCPRTGTEPNSRLDAKRKGRERPTSKKVDERIPGDDSQQGCRLLLE